MHRDCWRPKKCYFEQRYKVLQRAGARISCRSRKYFMSSSWLINASFLPGSFSRKIFMSISTMALTWASLASETCLAKAFDSCSCCSTLPCSILATNALQGRNQRNQRPHVSGENLDWNQKQLYIFSKQKPSLKPEQALRSALEGTCVSKQCSKSESINVDLNCTSKESFMFGKSAAGAMASSFVKKKRNIPQAWCTFVATLRTRDFRILSAVWSKSPITRSR